MSRYSTLVVDPADLTPLFDGDAVQRGPQLVPGDRTEVAATVAAASPRSVSRRTGSSGHVRSRLAGTRRARAPISGIGTSSAEPMPMQLHANPRRGQRPRWLAAARVPGHRRPRSRRTREHALRIALHDRQRASERAADVGAEERRRIVAHPVQVEKQAVEVISGVGEHDRGGREADERHAIDAVGLSAKKRRLSSTARANLEGTTSRARIETDRSRISDRDPDARRSGVRRSQSDLWRIIAVVDSATVTSASAQHGDVAPRGWSPRMPEPADGACRRRRRCRHLYWKCSSQQAMTTGSRAARQPFPAEGTAPISLPCAAAAAVWAAAAAVAAGRRPAWGLGEGEPPAERRSRS